MTKMVAVKAMRYGTRSLVAGEPFDARRMDARLLAGMGRASYSTEEEVVDEKERLSLLRAEYQAATGKRPFNGWDADALRAKIDAHREGRA